jgi:hypothetical protein
MGDAMSVIDELARRGLFRARDLKAWRLSRNWLPFAQSMGRVTPHPHGVWSHRNYRPTRYELAQVRVPRVVFWGPSARWLLGELDTEPDILWVAIGSAARRPRTLEHSTVIVRTRRLEEDVVVLRPEGRLVSLRVFSSARTNSDLARADCDRLLERTQEAVDFSLPRHAVLLTNVVEGIHPRFTLSTIPNYGESAEGWCESRVLKVPRPAGLHAPARSSTSHR